jgi:hypothetical protein
MYGRGVFIARPPRRCALPINGARHAGRSRRSSCSARREHMGLADELTPSFRQAILVPCPQPSMTSPASSSADEALLPSVVRRQRGAAPEPSSARCAEQAMNHRKSHPGHPETVPVVATPRSRRRYREQSEKREDPFVVLRPRASEGSVTPPSRPSSRPTSTPTRERGVPAAREQR